MSRIKGNENLLLTMNDTSISDLVIVHAVENRFRILV